MAIIPSSFPIESYKEYIEKSNTNKVDDSDALLILCTHCFKEGAGGRGRSP